MWRRILALAVLLPILPLSSCAMSKAGFGLIYTDVTASYAVTAQANVKRGEACASTILGLIATGDAAAATAAKNGGIVSIGAIDERSFSILGLYQQHCTIVHGK